METILVVDDNPEVLDTVASILSAANFNVLTAASGPDAIELAHASKQTIDLLLSDWDMPDMTGPALGRVLQVLRPDIHVMLMSGGYSGALMIYELRVGAR